MGYLEFWSHNVAEPKENEWDIDSLHFKRWDWILNEEIWAFEQLVNEDAESQFFDHSECKPGRKPWDSDEYKKVKYDKEGYEAWQKRMDNGFRLFGKYYRNHWDWFAIIHMPAFNVSNYTFKPAMNTNIFVVLKGWAIIHG